MIFLRPWFLVLLCMPLILYFLNKKLSAENPFAKIVDAHLLPFLTVSFGTARANNRLVILTLLWSLLSVAMAGPAFEKVSAPALLQAPSTVIVLDLSQSMSGNNLSVAKRKIHDLLKTLKGQQIGLVLYDSKGYVAVPLTQDAHVIETVLPSLASSVLPAKGNRPEKGFEKANELFKNIGAKAGQIVFLTAGGFDEKTLVQTAQKMPWVISTIGLGDEDGSVVPLEGGGFLKSSDGSLVRVKLNPEELSRMGWFTYATITDEDINTVKDRTPRDKASFGHEADTKTEVWKDMGPVLVLCAVPFFLLLFRKGVLFIFIVGISFSSSAGFFTRPDQEAHQSLLQGVEAYRASSYEAAKALFEKGRGPDSFYNAGNALAHMGDIQGAIAAYEKALTLNPSHAEAKYNKAYLEKQLKSPEDQQPQTQPQDASKTQEQQQGQPEQKEQQKQTADNQQNSSDQPPQDLPEQNQDSAEQQDSQSSPQESNKSESGDSKNSKEMPAGQEPVDKKQGSSDDRNAGENNDEASSEQQQSKQEQVNMQQNQAQKDDTQESAEPPQNQKVPHEFEEDQDDRLANNESNEPEDKQNSEEPQKDGSRLGEDFYQPYEDQLDQESQQLLNRIKQDPSRLMRFRLKQQYRRAYETENL